MMRLCSAIFLTVLCLLRFSSAFAQGNSGNISVSIPSVSLVAIRGAANTDVSLGLIAPHEAGLAAAKDADSSMWLNYSFIKGKNSKTKNDVYVKIASGSVPNGIALKLRAKASSSHGKGTKGTPTGEVTLTSSDQKIIQNIKSSHTGKGWGQGHNLVYTLDVTNYSTIQFTAPIALTITYTIID